MKTSIKKTFMISKLEDKQSYDHIYRSFENVDSYLKPENGVIIGKVIRGPRFDKSLKVLPYSIVGSVSRYTEAQILKNQTSSRNNLQYSAKSSRRQSSASITVLKKENINKNYDLTDDNKLKNVFNEHQLKISQNKQKANEFMNQLPEIIKSSLKSQENKLDTYQNQMQKSANLSRFLSKRVKKDESELLINNYSKVRMKREIDDFIENHKSLEEKYGKFNWNVSLRRPKNFNGKREIFINMNDKYNLIWIPITETNPKVLELIRNKNNDNTLNKNIVMETNQSTSTLLNTLDNCSKYTDKSIDKIIDSIDKRYRYHTIEKTNDNLNLDFQLNIEKLEIKGEDLLQIEIELAKSLHGRKIIYRRDYLDRLSLINHNNNKSSNDKIKINLSSDLNLKSDYNTQIPIRR